MNGRLTVLMSTYNGLPWLDEQLDSIARQTWPDIRLRIRDDGSTDGTPTRLRALAQTSRLSDGVVFGKNVGVFQSFMSLLAEAGEDSAYYAFCDQDDVWLPDKCERAVRHLQGVPPEVPAMVYTRLRFTDEHLTPTGWSPVPTESGFHNALVQNQATGCTIVLNAAARRKILESVPDWALMHDWWCYLVVSAFGTVIYDPEPGVLYRKHGSNVTPAAPTGWAEFRNRLRRFRDDPAIVRRVTDQAREFRFRYGHDMPPAEAAMLAGFLEARSRGWFGRLRYALTMPVRRNTPLDTLLMRLLIVVGRF